MNVGKLVYLHAGTTRLGKAVRSVSALEASDVLLCIHHLEVSACAAGNGNPQVLTLSAAWDGRC